VHNNLSGCFALLQAAELKGIRGACGHLEDACKRLQEQLEEKEAAFAVRMCVTVINACSLPAEGGSASCAVLFLKLKVEVQSSRAPSSLHPLLKGLRPR
jgi:hypothetical protein